MMIMMTSGQRILTKSRIAVLSPLAAANGFVRPWPRLIMVPWANSTQFQNGHSIDSAVFRRVYERDQQTDRQANRQTDRARHAVCSNSKFHIYWCTCMKFKTLKCNNKNLWNAVVLNAAFISRFKQNSASQSNVYRYTLDFVIIRSTG